MSGKHAIAICNDYIYARLIIDKRVGGAASKWDIKSAINICRIAVRATQSSADAARIEIFQCYRLI